MWTLTVLWHVFVQILLTLSGFRAVNLSEVWRAWDYHPNGPNGLQKCQQLNQISSFSHLGFELCRSAIFFMLWWMFFHSCWHDWTYGRDFTSSFAHKVMMKSHRNDINIFETLGVLIIKWGHAYFTCLISCCVEKHSGMCVLWSLCLLGFIAKDFIIARNGRRCLLQPQNWVSSYNFCVLHRRIDLGRLFKSWPDLIKWVLPPPEGALPSSAHAL